MYNRYIGNTGKFTRVNDSPGTHPRHAPGPSLNGPSANKHPAEPHHISAPYAAAPEPPPPPEHEAAKKKPGLLGMLGGLGSNYTGGLNKLFEHLPFGLDVGDLLLFLLLLFFFLESGDEEFLIILGIIAFSIFKER